MRCVQRTCRLRQKKYLVFTVGGLGLAIEERHATNFSRDCFCRYRATSHIEIPAPIPGGPLEVGPTEIVPSTIRVTLASTSLP